MKCPNCRCSDIEKCYITSGNLHCERCNYCASEEEVKRFWKEKRMKSKSKVRCGICDKDNIQDWKKHSESEEHIRNLLNPIKVQETVDDHIFQMRKFGKGYPYGVVLKKK